MPEPEVRIDTVRFAYDTRESTGRPHGARAQVYDLGTDREAWAFSADLPEGGQVMWGNGPRAVVELNVSKAKQGHNVEALDLADTLEVAREAFDWAQLWIPAAVPFEDAFVNRLDLVRDFEGVTRPVQTLSALRSVPMRGRATARLFNDAHKGGAITLTKGNGARSSTLYDKGAEVLKFEPKKPSKNADADEREAYREACARHRALVALAEGRLRFEARVRKEPLRRAGVTTMQDVTPFADNVVRLGWLRRQMFGWAGFDREVSALARVTEAVLSDPELSNRERATCLGYFLLASQGHEVGRLFSSNTQRKYERVASTLGLVLDGTAPTEAGTFVARLDYDQGVEVVHAA